jgi:hypothetical protein
MKLNLKLKSKLQNIRQNNFLINHETQLSVMTFNISNEISSKTIVNSCNEFRKQFPISRESSVVGWHSGFFTHLFTNNFDNLINLISKKITENYFNQQLKPIPAHLWINMLEGGDFIKRHKHEYFCYSCVYYPLVMDNPSPIIFDNNNLKNYKEIVITPEEGMLVIFPGIIHHRVSKLYENERRISVSGNFSMVFKSDINIYEQEKKYGKSIYNN